MLTDYRDRAVTFAVEAGELPPMSPEDCVLVDMPLSALREAEAFGGPDEWHVDVQLWWSNDCAGHDLTLQAEVHSTGDGVDVQLMSLHVL